MRTTNQKARSLSLALGAFMLTGLAACAGSSGETGSAGDDPVQVAVIAATSGPYAGLGNEFVVGFKAGVDYVTDGTGEIDGRSVEVEYLDSTGDPTTAVSVAKTAVVGGAKFLIGSTTSAESLQVAPIAEHERVLFMPLSATDALTGINEFTFRSHFQDAQVTKTMLRALEGIDTLEGKRMMVLTQDNAYGESSMKSFNEVFGDSGAELLDPVLIPDSAKDFTPFAAKVKSAAPDYIAMFWAASTDASVLDALKTQGVLENTTMVRSLPSPATWPAFQGLEENVLFATYYVPSLTAADDEPGQALLKLGKKYGTVERTSIAGFRAAQLIAHAVQEGGDDVDAQVEALEGWSFDSPKGESQIRAEDHAMIQPMLVARLVNQGGSMVPELIEIVPAEEAAP